MQFEAGSHRTNLWFGEEARAMLRVLEPVAFGNQLFNGLPQHLLPRVAEQHLRLRIDEDNGSVAVHDDNRIGSGLEESAEFVFGLLALADVANGTGNQQSFL